MTLVVAGTKATSSVMMASSISCKEVSVLACVVSKARAEVLRLVPALAVIVPSIVKEPPLSSTERTPVESLAIVTL